MQDDRTEALIDNSRGDMSAMLKAVHCMTLQSPGKFGSPQVNSVHKVQFAMSHRLARQQQTRQLLC